MQKILYIPIDTTIKNTVECIQLVKRGDTLILQIKVFNNAVLAELTGQDIDLILKKSDGTLIEKTITSVSNGVITATLDVQATNVVGLVNGEVQIYTSNTLASTNTFTFNVDASLADDVLAKSQDDIEVLADLKNTISQGNSAIDKYKTNVEAIAGTAGAVEALAGIKNYIDTNLSELESENAKAAINIENESTQNTQATKNITDLTAVNTTASQLKSDLDTDITTGNTLKSGLENDITTGNTLKGNLETDFVTGNQLKSDLDSRNSTGNALKTNLDAANTQAEANIDALNKLGDVTTIAQDVTNLKTEVENARGSEVNLDTRLDKIDTNIVDNSNKIGDLTGNGITEANLALAIKNDRASLSEKTQQIADLNANKIDKTSIINNLATTEEGFVLDARQGKILANKLQKEITLSTVVNVTGTYNNDSQYNCRAFTNGNNVSVQGMMYCNTTPSSSIQLLGALPIPKYYGWRKIFGYDNSQNFNVYIKPDGTLWGQPPVTGTYILDFSYILTD